MKMAESSLNGLKNTVGKGEIARYEQFLLFPQCFQRACFPEASKGVIVWEWVNKPLLINLESFSTDVIFSKKLIENIKLKHYTMLIFQTQAR